jgi:hypothetical protein
MSSFSAAATTLSSLVILAVISTTEIAASQSLSTDVPNPSDPPRSEIDAGDAASMKPPLTIGKAGKVEFKVSRVINPKECVAEIQFVDHTHVSVVMKINTTGYVEGQEIKPNKPFKVIGSTVVSSYEKGLGLIEDEAFVLEEVSETAGEAGGSRKGLTSETSRGP